MTAAVLMMQKDEGQLLEDWLNYYDYVFGLSNCYVFDNGSEDPLTMEILQKWEGKGLKIQYCPGHESFENKGMIILNKINELNNRYDYFYPVDCDEFLARFQSTEVFQIEKDLEPKNSTDLKKRIFRIHHAIWNVPNSNLGYYTDMRKIIVKKNADLEYLDIGLHLFNFMDNVPEIPAEEIEPTDIGLIHFHNRPFKELLDKTKLKLMKRLNLNSPEEVDRFKGDGVHLIPYLKMTEQQYLDGINSKACFDIGGEFFKHGLKMPFSS